MAKILIVDDSADTVELSTELLESAGHHVDSGHNGEEGLASLLKGRLPDCIVLDVDMPVLNGPEMARQMVLHDAGEEAIPIVLVSGRAEVGEIAKSIGTPYFLTKGAPAYCKALVAMVERALSEHRPRAATLIRLAVRKMRRTWVSPSTFHGPALRARGIAERARPRCYRP